MSARKFLEILEKVQLSSASHQKCLQILTKIYEKSDADEFVDNFVKCLAHIFQQPIDKNNIYIKRALDFFSIFCAEIARKEEQTINDQETNRKETFLPMVFTEIFPFCDLNYVEIRYHSCLFIMNVLLHIGSDVQLENSLCDQIQEVMLQRLEYDNRLEIRLQAISALVRLQEPSETYCPVISAYMKCLNDHHHVIRRRIIEVIAVCYQTLPLIIERINDIDMTVRCITYNRLADIGPLIISINDRLTIIKDGLNDNDNKVKTVFYNVLLNKWLISYNNDYFQLLKGLKLSRNEIDLNVMAKIGKKVLQHFIKSHPIINLIELLPIDNNKLIKNSNFNNETILYLYCLVKYFRSDDNFDNYLEEILPELTHFCHYIERMITDKYQSNDKMDECEIAEFEFNLLYLFKIVKGYDFADEVGRLTTHTLITKILTKYQFNNRKLIMKLLEIQLIANIEVEKFLENIQEIINEICEPAIIINQPLSKYDIIENKFKIAQFSTRIFILQEEQEEAVKNQQYDKAGQINIELKQLRDEFDLLKQQIDIETTTTTTTTQRIKRTDQKTLCYCLEILINLLKLKEINKLTTILINLKDNLLLTINNNNNDEIQWRYLECLCLYCLCDKNLAEQYYRDILSPILVYKYGNYTNMEALKIAVCGFADLICLYGTEIIKLDDNSNNNTNNNNNTTKRRLYTQSICESSDNNSKHLSDSVTFSVLLDAILTILDNEIDDVKITTILALCKILPYITLTSNVISRILLKWFNPIIEKNEKIYTTIGYFVETFLKFVKNPIEIIRDSITTILFTIVDAPTNSPLKTINFDVILDFFVTLINSEQDVQIRISVLDIIGKISDDSNKKIVQLLSKILLYLNLVVNNAHERDEIVSQIETIMPKIDDKVAKRYLEKFIIKLNKNIQINDKLPDITEINTSKSDNQSKSVIDDDENNEDDNHQNDEIPRRKTRSQSLLVCSKIVQNGGINHTKVDEGDKIKTPLPTNRQTKRKKRNKNSKNSMNTEENKLISDRNVAVIAEDTSDTDNCNSMKEVPPRRSLRLRRKT